MFGFLTSKKGFTLTEMIVCILIIGILAAIAIPAFGSVVYTQKKRDCKNQRTVISAVVNQIMSGMMDNGAPQDYILIAKTKVSSTHKITTYDKDGNAIGEKEEACVDVLRKDENNVLVDGFYYDENTGYYSDKRDYKCDICGGDMKWKYDGYDHITKDHIVYKDKDGNELHAANEQGFEAKRDKLEDWKDGDKRKDDTYSKYEEKDDGTGTLIVSQISPDGFLYLDKATVGDIRGGYRKSDSAYDGYKKGCEEGYFLKKKAMENIPIKTYLANQELPVCPFNEKDDKGKYKYFYYIAADGEVYCTCPECSVY